MAKLVVLPVLIVLLAMHTSINAFGLVRVDIQKDNSGVALANAIGNAISSKIQSWNSILNSLLQVKYSYGGTTTAGSSTSGSSTSGSTVGGSTTTYGFAPLYTKVVHINSGYAAAAPTSSRVAARIDADDDDHVEAAPAVAASTGTVSTGVAVTPVRTLVTVNKSLIGVPAVSVSTSPVVAAGSASVATSAASPNSIGYSYRKRYIYN